MPYGVELAYHNLAMRVVIKAVEDYKNVLKQCRHQKAEKYGYIDPRTIKAKHELEAFFDSDWCTLLCGMDGRDVKNRIKNRIYREVDL